MLFFWLCCHLVNLYAKLKNEQNRSKNAQKVSKNEKYVKKWRKMKNTCFSVQGISVWHNPCQLTLIKSEKDEIQYAQRVVEFIQRAPSIQ